MATYARKTRIRPTVLEQPSPELLPGVSIDELATIPQSTKEITDQKWWKDIPQNEQIVLQSEGEKIATMLLLQGYTKLALGAHFIKVQAILEPRHLFGRFLRLFRHTPRTAYRYIQRYKNASSHLPEMILRTALVKGIEISGESEQRPLGKYTNAAKALPPPVDPNEEQAGIWLDSVVKAAKEKNDTPERTDLAVPIPQDPDTLLKECYRFCSLRYRKLPINSRIRKTWVHHLSGMLLTDLGVGHAQSVAPIAVPEEFRAMRGRPRDSTNQFTPMIMSNFNWDNAMRRACDRSFSCLNRLDNLLKVITTATDIQVTFHIPSGTLILPYFPVLTPMTTITSLASLGWGSQGEVT